MSDGPALAASGRCDECGFDVTALDNAALVDLIGAFLASDLVLTTDRPQLDIDRGVRAARS